MDATLYRYAFWTILIMAGATAVILYQHALHTGTVLDMLPRSDSTTPQPITDSPGNIYGAASRASGLWTPLGPTHDASVFPYNPPQRHQ